MLCSSGKTPEVVQDSRKHFFCDAFANNLSHILHPKPNYLHATSAGSEQEEQTKAKGRNTQLSKRFAQGCGEHSFTVSNAIIGRVGHIFSKLRGYCGAEAED